MYADISCVPSSRQCEELGCNGKQDGHEIRAYNLMERIFRDLRPGMEHSSSAELMTPRKPILLRLSFPNEKMRLLAIGGKSWLLSVCSPPSHSNARRNCRGNQIILLTRGGWKNKEKKKKENLCIWSLPSGINVICFFEDFCRLGTP